MIEGLLAFFCLVLVWAGQTIFCEGFFWFTWKMLCRDIERGIIKEDIFSQIDKIQKMASIGMLG